MKIIQTYWNAKGEDFDHVKCGWLTPETHWMAWALSCTLLRRFYNDVELYTTEKDAEIFKKFNIPYTKIHTSLDCDFIKNLEPSMWAYAKIYTYSLQEEPFLHVDGDVFIWEAFDKSLFSGDICVQNVEENLKVYHKSIETLLNTEGAFIPEWIYTNKDYPMAYNMGIFGSNNIPFVKEYCKIAFEYYKKNKSLFSQMHKTDPNVNLLPEQYLLYAIKENKLITQRMLIADTINKDRDFAKICDTCKSKEELTFLHTLGTTKKNLSVNDFIPYCLLQENKDCYTAIHTHFPNQNVKQHHNPEDFYEKYIKSISECNKKLIHNKNEVLSELHRLRIILQKTSIRYQKNDLITPFPFYDGKKIESLDAKKHYIGINPNHIVLQTSFDFISIINNDFKLKEENTQPTLMFCIVFFGANSEYYKHLWISLPELLLIEKLKSKTHAIADIINSYQDDRTIHIYKLIETLYNNEFIYFSTHASDIISQKSSNTYNNIINQLKHHILQIFNKIEEITGTSLDNIKISEFMNQTLLDIIKILNNHCIQTKAFKCDTIEQLHDIKYPILSIMHLSQFIPLYIIILKISKKHITIYNPLSNIEETYLIDNFNTMWSGYIVTLN